jgi:hypothetical protein
MAPLKFFAWDTDAPRLAVRVTAGAKAFIFESKLNRQTVRADHRRCSRVDARQAARDEARRLQTMIDQGIDPRQEKRDRITAAAAKIVPKRKPHAKRRSALQRRHSTHGKPTLWRARRNGEHAHCLTIRTCLTLAANQRREPVTQGRRRDNTAGHPAPFAGASSRTDNRRPCVRMAERRNRPPADSSKPCFPPAAWLPELVFDSDEYKAQVHTDACASKAKDELPKQGVKDDCLQREQLPLWFAHVRQIGNPVVAAYLQALLLTGARREELAGLTWEDLDFQWKSMTIRDKVEGERVIPLTPYVASLLAALPRRNQWVFASPRLDDCAIQDKRTMHVKALAAAGLPALTCMACAVRLVHWRSGQNARLESQRKSWATSQAPLPRSITAAARSICYACGTPRLKAGFSTRQVSSSLPRIGGTACELSVLSDRSSKEDELTLNYHPLRHTMYCHEQDFLHQAYR